MTVHQLDTAYTCLLYLCAAGQVIFVFAWFTVPWWKTLIGSALMAKSLSLAITLSVLSTFRLTHANLSIENFYKVYILLFALMFLGISFQDFAILRELRRNKREM